MEPEKNMTVNWIRAVALSAAVVVAVILLAKSLTLAERRTITVYRPFISEKENRLVTEAYGLGDLPYGIQMVRVKISLYAPAFQPSYHITETTFAVEKQYADDFVKQLKKEASSYYEKQRPSIRTAPRSNKIVYATVRAEYPFESAFLELYDWAKHTGVDSRVWEWLVCAGLFAVAVFPYQEMTRRLRRKG